MKLSPATQAAHAVAAPRRAAAARMADAGVLSGGPRSAYRASDPLDQAIGGWRGSLGSADQTWLHGRLTAIARARDLERNDPLASGAVSAKAAALVGPGWRFSSAPDASALGLEVRDPAIKRLADSIEREWRYWANDPLFRCDWEEQLDFDLMLLLAVRHKVIDGEAVGIVCWRPRRDAFRYSTAIQLVDPDRLTNPAGRPDTATLRGGVEFDADGRPYRYHIREGHPADIGLAAMKGLRSTAFAAREPWGRPRVIHLFEKKRAGQSRGVGDLVSGLRRFKVLDAFTDAELRSSLINATIIASLTSSMDSEYLSEVLGSKQETEAVLGLRSQFYDDSQISVGGSKVLKFFPGDSLAINDQPRQTPAYGDFVHAIAAQLGGGMGSTYEMITGDFTRHNYSSGRMSMLQAWRQIVTERALIAKKWATQVLLCVTEEAWYGGHLDLPMDAPDFWDAPGAYVRGRWIGPSRGQIDPVKEPQGQRLNMENLSMSPSDIAAENGRDFEEVVITTSRDLDFAREMNVGMGDLRTMMAAQGTSEAPGEADRRS